MQIDKKTYKEILEKVLLSIAQTQNEIVRSKVEMAWRIGKVIDESLPKKRAKEYGKNLVALLEKDTEISSTVLYKMRNFYKAYPELPKDDAQLNWSHYRVLAGVKEKDKRKTLEDLTKENRWSGDELQKQITKNKKKSVEAPKLKTIQPNRGVVSAYKIVEVFGSDKKFFDCGFGIFSEVKSELPKDVKVVFVDGSKITESSAKPEQVYTYKAYLKRLVDGDTIHANIDLGFGIFHEEIIRLAKINAAEGKSDEGKSVSAELQKIFDSVPFFILKSIKTDIYNRYVCDIFLPDLKAVGSGSPLFKGDRAVASAQRWGLHDQPLSKGDRAVASAQRWGLHDLQKIADDGIYLNQLLLDRGLVELF